MILTTYLLEKVRVVSHSPKERTYHVFYALLLGASSAQREHWGLRSQSEHALTQGGEYSDAPAIAEGSAAKFQQLREALKCLTLREEEQIDLLGLVAVILHLCDVRFVALDEGSESGCRPIGSASLAQAVKLLGCPGISLRLVQRVVLTGNNEPITMSLSPAQAAAARDALCKAIYVAIFQHIARRFNAAAAQSSGPGLRSPDSRKCSRNAPDTPGSISIRRRDNGASYAPPLGSPPRIADKGVDAPFIGLLDMFGFEIFETNSFEQLCINLANERLQSYFQHCVFRAEEEVHRLEGVPWPADVEYHDNRGCISLICDHVFNVLDEACGLQTTTEASFFLRVGEVCARDPFFTTARRHRLRDDEGFIIRHFAGDVCYSSSVSAICASGAPHAQAHGAEETSGPVGDTWLVKNADRLLPELASDLRSSSSPLVAALFARETGQAGRSGRATVVRRFCAGLDELLSDLALTHSRFVRCIKPNNFATPKLLERPNVLAQLRCLGMTDVVRLMHKAFPTRIPYAVLHGRYAACLPAVLASLPPRDFCEAVALLCEVDPSDLHLGTTRLFLRGGKGAFLEDLGEMDVQQAMPILLAKIDQMNRRRAAGKLVAGAVRTYHLHARFRRRKRANATIVPIWRGALARAKTRAERRRLAALRCALPSTTVQNNASVPEDALDDAPSAAASAMFDDLLAANHMTDVTVRSQTSKASSYVAAQAPAPSSAIADEALLSTLGVQPLCTAQIRAIHALRQRLGEALSENSEVIEQKVTMRAPGAAAAQPEQDMQMPARRRLNHPGSLAPGKEAPPPGLPPSHLSTSGTRIEVGLTRDARDGTLGIDLDQFAGKPTVAVVVAGGPAERGGAVRAGDIILAIDGIAVADVAEVITLLTSPSISAKNPLTVQLLRKDVYAVADDALLVRATPLASATDGVAGIGGTPIGSDAAGDKGLPPRLSKLAEWTRCRCRLFSDRRISISEEALEVDAGFDLRASKSVQLVTVPNETRSPQPGCASLAERSCLQVRTEDFVLELCPLSNEETMSLFAWQSPLEQMLMTSLATVCKGWLWDLSASSDEVAGTSTPRVFLDLNRHAQLRTVSEAARPCNLSHLGIVELAELQSISLVPLQEPYVLGPSMADVAEVLHVSSNEMTCVLASDLPEELKRWAQELGAAHRRALVALVQYTGMILIDGWLEYQGEEDEWASGFFILTIGGGLQCFEDVVTEPMSAVAIETIPIEQITCAVRSKGIDYYDWCIDVRTTGSDYIRVRPPRQSEMTRWLATLNLYCTPPPKRKPEKPLRRATDGSERSPQRHANRYLRADFSNAASSCRVMQDRLAGGLQCSSSTVVVPGGTSNIGLISSAGGHIDMRPAGRLGGRSLAAMAREAAVSKPAEERHYPALAQANAPAPSAAPVVQKRTLSFGRRRTASFGRRRKSTEAAPASAPAADAPAATAINAAVGAPSRGGRLRAKRLPVEEGRSAEEAPSSGRSLSLRRPSFSRRTQRQTKQAADPGSSASTESTSAMSLSTVSLAATGANPDARPSQPLRARALSFGRARRMKPTAKSDTDGLPVAPALAHAQSGPVFDHANGEQGQLATRLPTDAPPEVSSRDAGAPSFGRKLARRAASFGTRRRGTRDALDQ